ncbi:hypothetical protein Zmor_013356 [Zophobas morio]|uniref:Uncharacterized protein n=1 Tax=Zophobas morio TaxID=2755281 RepID=A0AA38IDW2_9CUCU|nr:hypothetical protein Zmor_013356 [Zophobas morio]
MTIQLKLWSMTLKGSAIPQLSDFATLMDLQQLTFVSIGGAHPVITAGVAPWSSETGPCTLVAHISPITRRHSYFNATIKNCRCSTSDYEWYT